MGAACCSDASSHPTKQQKRGIETVMKKKPFVEKVQQTIFTLVKEGLHDLIAISVPKDGFKDFIKTDLAAILQRVNESEKRVLLPTSICNSVTMPDRDVTIILRCHTNVKNISLDGWFTTNIFSLCQKLIVREIIFDPSLSLDQLSDLMSETLCKLHRENRLNLIGGFQKTPTSFELLFFKQDTPTPGEEELQLYMHNLTCEQWGSTEDQRSQIEENIQMVHLDQDGVLRCTLTLKEPRSENSAHIMIFILSNQDKMYTVWNFPEHLQDQLEEDIDVKKLKEPNYDCDISRALNVQEKAFGNGASLSSIMINQDFDSSYIVTATNADSSA